MNFRRFIAPWIIALVLIGIVETAIYWIYHPNSVERSDFLVLPIQRNLTLLAERWIIWDKLRKLPAEAPIAVQAGDSSGFYGIMPDVVGSYIGGKQLLDLSCCANQGFQGYLALLEYALQKYPSLRYAIVYASPIVTLDHTLWPSGKAEEITFGPNVTMPVLGDAMQADLLSYRRYIYPPSNALRPQIDESFLTLGHHPLGKPADREPNPVFARADVMHLRNGYMIEHDLQTAAANACQPLVAPRDPATGRTYWDLFAEAFVALGRKYNITPVIVFQPTTVMPCAQNAAFRSEIARLRTVYPSLKIPYDLVETWPENFFSVPAHVQHTVAIETSRRLGRALRALENGDDRAPDLMAEGPIEPDPKIHVIGATLVQECGWSPDYNHGFYADVSAIFREACDGKTSCTYKKGSEARDHLPPDEACKPVYVVDYQCPDEPVRSVREEGRESFDGVFRIDCRRSSFLARDPMPYGIEIAYATYGAGTGGVIGNASTPFAASCQGLMTCDYPVDANKLGGPDIGPSKRLEVSYRCNRELATRTISLPRADPGAIVHLDCTHQLAAVGRSIATVDARIGGICGAASGDADYLLSTICEGKAKCSVTPRDSALDSAAPYCAADTEALYRCTGSEQSYRAEVVDQAALIDCGSH